MPEELTNTQTAVLHDASACIMPSAPGTKTISVRVSKELYDKIATAADAEGRPMGNWLARAGIAALEKAGIAPPAKPRKRRARRS